MAADQERKKSRIRLRTRKEGDVTTVSVMMRHPMETGRRKDPEQPSIKDALIPRNHIEQFICRLNDEVVMCADIGAGISVNPFLSFTLTHAKAGDVLSVAWVDTAGEQEEFKTRLT